MIIVELSMPDATWTQEPVDLAPPRYPTAGVSRLAVPLRTSETGVVRVAVLFTPEGTPTTAITPRPLAQWEAQGPVE